MTSGIDGKPDIVALIETIAGASAFDDGHQIKVGVVSKDGIKADLIMSTDRAIDLIATVATVLGQAARNRTDDPKMRYVLPAERWEIEPIRDPHKLTLAFRLPGGGELCFQIDRLEAQNMHKALGVILGLVEPMPIPQSEKH